MTSSETIQDAKPDIFRSWLELLVAAFVFVSVFHFAQIRYAGPAAIVATVLAISVLLRLRGQSWAELGLKRPKTIGSVLLGLILTILAVAAVALLVTLLMPTMEQYLGPQTQSGSVSKLDTLPEYLTILLIAWTTAAVGEEIVFRGFVLTKVSEILGSTTAAWGLAAIIQAVFFGLAHYSQSAFGIVQTGLIGLIFGILYLVGRRNLLPLILAHGVVNTISITQTYLGE